MSQKAFMAGDTVAGMIVAIEKMLEIRSDLHICCQVAASEPDGGYWSMRFEVLDVINSTLVQVRVYSENLLRLLPKVLLEQTPVIHNATRADQVLETLKKLDPNKSIIAQVVPAAENSGAWNMCMEYRGDPADGLVYLTLCHPGLLSLVPVVQANWYPLQSPRPAGSVPDFTLGDFLDLFEGQDRNTSLLEASLVALQLKNRVRVGFTLNANANGNVSGNITLIK